MTRRLVLFEDVGWRTLRPLTDVLPVPAIAFGASTLGERWRDATGWPLAAIIARAGVMDAWEGHRHAAGPTAGDDECVAINAAALPGPWMDRVLADAGPSLHVCGARIACARAPASMLESGFGRGAEFETFLRSLGLEARPVEARFVTHPWDLIAWNADALALDLEKQPAAIDGDVHPQAVLLEPERIAIESGARVDPLVVLDARRGPIRIAAGSVVHPHTLVVGPCMIGSGTELLGGSITRSTLGPQCRVAGEVEECVWQGHANKRHHGFVGHSVIAEWVNLGALTTTSDLKNNYGSVRVWIDGREVDSGSAKVGSIIGAHVKTGIGTLLPTGATLGTGSNLFGGGSFAPKRTPSFAWWDGSRIVEHRLDPFLETARIAMSRRGRTMSSADEALLRAIHASTARERAAEANADAPAVAGRSGA